MHQLFLLFYNICILRANAEDVPASHFLMAVVLVLYTGLSIVISLIDSTLPQAIISVIVGLIMLIGFTLSGLWIKSYMNRAQQTITALAGSGILFNLLTWPLALLAARFPPEQYISLRMLFFLILLWQIAVIGHILRNALTIPLWAGIGISVLYVFTYIRVMGALFLASH